MYSSPMDPVELARALIRCPSVTPKDEGALAVLEEALTPLGFVCHRLHFEEEATAPVDNLYARLGTQAPNFCFAGHTDVVPPGEASLWRHPPFAAQVEDGVLYGRGAADMKSGIAAFVAAASRHGRPAKGSISLLITGDEEGPAVNGTPKMLGWLKARGETLDHCIVGEPASRARSGDTLKIGRRGSLNARLTVRGAQGHVGYPHQARNPIPALARIVDRLSSIVLDAGTEHFEPSTLSFTSVDVGNPATNVIPAEARAAFNIRFNDSHTPDSLQQLVRAEIGAAAPGYGIDLVFPPGSQAFLTKPGAFTALVADAIRQARGIEAEFSTAGGTSDARFIKDHCPVAELGLPGGTMHKTDECVAVAEIHALSDIYLAILKRYFAS